MELSSLVKALTVLEATAADAAGRSLSSIASEACVPKPTAHRILKTLVGLGYIEQTTTGAYRQTPRVQRLVSNDGSERLASLAEPVLQALHDATQETVNLGVLRGDQVVYLRVLESTQPLRRVATPNSIDPFHSTALGRAIASRLPDTLRDGLIRRAKIETRTPHTNVDRQSLAAILKQATLDGYALEIDETDVGVTCIGAPLLENGAAVGAISISVPTARATGDALAELIRHVRRAADEVNALLNPPSTTRKNGTKTEQATSAGQRSS